MSSLLFGHIGPLVAARLYNSYQPFFQFQERQHKSPIQADWVSILARFHILTMNCIIVWAVVYFPEFTTHHPQSLIYAG